MQSNGVQCQMSHSLLLHRRLCTRPPPTSAISGRVHPFWQRTVCHVTPQAKVAWTGGSRAEVIVYSFTTMTWSDAPLVVIAETSVVFTPPAYSYCICIMTRGGIYGEI